MFLNEKEGKNHNLEKSNNAWYLANICSKELILTQDWSSGCLGVQLELHTDDPNSISEKNGIYR